MSRGGKTAGRRAVLLAAAAAAALAGCGFRPVYRDGDGAFAVALKGDSGRLGRHFRESWRRRAGEPGAKPEWILEIELGVTQTGLAISADDDITRYDVDGAARFSLRRPGAAEPTASGAVKASSAYSTLASPFATRTARRDAERRVAEALAERVFFRLAPVLTRPE